MNFGMMFYMKTHQELIRTKHEELIRKLESLKSQAAVAVYNEEAMQIEEQQIKNVRISCSVI